MEFNGRAQADIRLRASQVAALIAVPELFPPVASVPARGARSVDGADFATCQGATLLKHTLGLCDALLLRGCGDDRHAVLHAPAQQLLCTRNN